MQEQNSPEKSNVDNPQITSEGVSMPILNPNESAWPPPNIREEVVEGIKEEESTHPEGEQAQQTPSSSATTPAGDPQITSEGVSMPILNPNESAWPPPNIREEVVEGIKEEESTHPQE